MIVNYLTIAAEMMGCEVENLPIPLRQRLDHMQFLCRKVGADLISWGIISLVVAEYQGL